ncbi:MAG: CBS domain-containing protein [Verrucomicrobiae bacterium]|nr:CBS domain-containing protein [Verrucomicrobiae bacterium]
MHVPGTIQSVLNLKQNPDLVYTISPDATVFEVLQILADKNVGALIVVDKDKPIGIVSERDYARKVILHGRHSKETLVKDIISKELITISPDQSVEDAMRLMTQHRVRHLPVLKEGKIIGIVSIGDLVNYVIKAQDQMIKQMENYIQGTYTV